MSKSKYLTYPRLNSCYHDRTTTQPALTEVSFDGSAVQKIPVEAYHLYSHLTDVYVGLSLTL